MNKWKKENLENIIVESNSKTEVIKKLGLSNHGGNYRTLSKYIYLYNIDTSHFFLDKQNNSWNFLKKDLYDILVENSTYNTNHLKNRLYKEGLKERKCELCDQGEEWR